MRNILLSGWKLSFIYRWNILSTGVARSQSLNDVEMHFKENLNQGFKKIIYSIKQNGKKTCIKTIIELLHLQTWPYIS